jgi:hypothetical protein
MSWIVRRLDCPSTGALSAVQVEVTVDSLSDLITRVAARASELTGVEAAEVETELASSRLPDGGWLARFTGPSLQVREAVEQAISELQG